MGPWTCVVGLKDKIETYRMSVLLESGGNKFKETAMGGCEDLNC
jgi:hypothetical protein